MSYVCEPTFEAPETVVRLVRVPPFVFRVILFSPRLGTDPRPRPPSQRARRHIRDAFASRQARGGDRRAAPRRAEKPTAAAVSRRFDSARDREDSRLTDDDVFVAVASAAGAGGAPARPGLVNVFAELIRETRSACGDGKAAALVVSLFLGMLASRKKSQRVVPFAAIANFALARGHGGDAEDDAARRWARGVAAELVAALLRDCETSKEVWRAGMNVLSALGSSHGGGDDRSDRVDAPEDAELLRVAALDAAAGARGARVSRTDIVEGCVWFTVRTGRETGS